MKKILITLFLVIMMACSNTRVRPDYKQFVLDSDLQTINRVQQFRFTGWQPLDTQYLILLGVQNRAYLLKLMAPCNDLPFTQQIALSQTSRTTLVAKFDKVLVKGQIPQSCTIDKIYELSKEQRQVLADYSGGHIKTTKSVD